MSGNDPQQRKRFSVTSVQEKSALASVSSLSQGPSQSRRTDNDVDGGNGNPLLRMPQSDGPLTTSTVYSTGIGTSSTSTSSSSNAMCESALAQRRSAQLPKLKEIACRARGGEMDNEMKSGLCGIGGVSIGGGDGVDLELTYDDCDGHAMEMAELYTYSEMDEWAANIQAFRNYADARLDRPLWSTLGVTRQRTIVYDLVERLESVQIDVRIDAARILLYLLQGAVLDFAEDDDDNAHSVGVGEAVKGTVLPIADRGTGGHEGECIKAGVVNAYRLAELDVFQALCTMLMVEANDTWDTTDGLRSNSRASSVSNSRSASNADLAEGVDRHKRRNATMADNEGLRLALTALYHMLEAIRRRQLIDTMIAPEQRAKCIAIRENFIQELDSPIVGVGQPLVLVLFDMMAAFCSPTAPSPHFPMRKVLLLLWKTLLATAGGWTELRTRKAAAREAAGLRSVEDTLLVAAGMKASALALDRDEPGKLMFRSSRRVSAHAPARMISRQLACTSTDARASSADEADIGVDDGAGVEGEGKGAASARRGGRSELGSDEDDGDLTDAVVAAGDEVDDEVLMDAEFDASESGPALRKSSAGATPIPTAGPRRGHPLASGQRERTSMSTSSGERTPIAGSPTPDDHASILRLRLPWQPKVREADIEAFLEGERQKFFNYHFGCDSTTLFGLPDPIHQSVAALRRHLYVPLSDLQLKREDELNTFVFSQRESHDDDTVIERLYRQMLPNMPQYVIALLKIMLAAAPSSKAKNEAINILCDLLTPETDGSEVLTNSMSLDSSMTNVLEQSVRITIDINRHKEVIVKAASSILLLLLKHFRLSHTLQFEYLAQQLVFANCIPLILKFFDQNMCRYVQSRNELRPLNFPAAALHFVRNGDEWPTLSAENVEDADASHSSGRYFLWRNVFSSINLLRVLNKLTKWKHARTMMLVVFKSAPILKRSLKVKQAIFQLYVLKLLKMQAKYLGRQWRRSNMEIMSSIYSKVRHRLNDDWAYGNETRSKPWDFQNEEAALKNAVERFNSRRYGHLYPALRVDPSEQQHPPSASRVDDSLRLTIGIPHASPSLDDLRDFHPLDNDLQSVLGVKMELSARFRRNYQRWVDAEVIAAQVDWDQLLASSRGIAEIAGTF